MSAVFCEELVEYRAYANRLWWGMRIAYALVPRKSVVLFYNLELVATRCKQPIQFCGCRVLRSTLCTPTMLSVVKYLTQWLSKLLVTDQPHKFL